MTNLKTELDFSRAHWRKSSRSHGSGDCVEVTVLAGRVGIRDSKNPYGGILVVSPGQWIKLLRGVKHEEFDL